MIELVNGFHNARSKKQFIEEESSKAGVTYEAMYEMLKANGAFMGTTPKHFTKQTQAEKQAAKKEIAELKVSEQEARYQENIRQLMAEVKSLREQLDAASCTVQHDDSERAKIEDLSLENSKLIEENKRLLETIEQYKDRLEKQRTSLGAEMERLQAALAKAHQKYEDCSRYADSLEESNRKLCDKLSSLTAQLNDKPATMTPMERAMLNMAMQIFGGANNV